MGQTPQTRADRVQELQGLYGPYAFPEKLLQKIWLLGLFERRAAKLADGRLLEVLAPGRWNLLGGPDFRGARLRIDGRDHCGDIEVHFHAADWQRHGHDTDPAYNDVVLHVLLFEPPAATSLPRTQAGREIAQFVLLPWLHCSLEEFAADDAVESLAQRDACRLAEALLALTPDERGAQLLRAAQKRWAQKLHFAGLRLERLGWEAACHHSALEILGYRFNRAAMLAVAERLPHPRWRGGIDPEVALAAGEGLWRHQGVRPANAPRRRLAQYAAWNAAVPDWPRCWAAFAAELPAGIPLQDLSTVAGARRRWALGGWAERIGREVVGGAVRGPRLATLVANGLLPLLAAHTGRDLFGLWYCGGPGEVPELISRALRLAGVVGRTAAPRHEGAAQGMLQYALEQPADWGN